MEEGHDISLEKIHSTYLGAEPWWLSIYGKKVLTPHETDEAYRSLDEKVFAALYPNESPAEALRVSKLVRKRWPELHEEIPLALYPDAEPTLSKLKDDGFSVGMVSNAPSDTGKVVEELGIARYFDSVVISGVVGYSKPHPEIFRIALKEVGAKPEEAVHIGDLYEADVVGARNAGIMGLLIDRDGARPELDCPRMKDLSETFLYLG